MDTAVNVVFVAIGILLGTFISLSRQRPGNRRPARFQERTMQSRTLAENKSTWTIHVWSIASEGRTRQIQFGWTEYLEEESGDRSEIFLDYPFSIEGANEFAALLEQAANGSGHHNK